MSLIHLDKQPVQFPHSEYALDEPNGLLCAGGDLTPDWLLFAYQHGIFPWFNEGEPILWWTPDPRLVVAPDAIHVSKSLKKHLKRSTWQVKFNHNFRQVMLNCSAPRADQDGTWISPDIINAYCQLHQLGFAHSVEVYDGDELIGGLYGMALGKVFFGESMFSKQSNASKTAFVALGTKLKELGFELIDCQVYTEHLASLGAVEIDRDEFEHHLARLITTIAPTAQDFA